MEQKVPNVSVISWQRCASTATATTRSLGHGTPGHPLPPHALAGRTHAQPPHRHRRDAQAPWPLPGSVSRSLPASVRRPRRRSPFASTAQSPRIRCSGPPWTAPTQVGGRRVGLLALAATTAWDRDPRGRRRRGPETEGPEGGGIPDPPGEARRGPRRTGYLSAALPAPNSAGARIQAVIALPTPMHPRCGLQSR